MAQPIVRQGESSEFIWKKSEVWPRDKFFKTLCVLKWKKEKQIPQDVVVSNLSEKAFYIPPQLYTSEVYCAFPVIILMEEIDPNTWSYSAVGTQQIFIPSAVIWKKKKILELGKMDRQWVLSRNSGTVESPQVSTSSERAGIRRSLMVLFPVVFL